MQVFVPYKDFQKSVESLDTKRLVKQALEATQLLDIMFNLPTKSGKPRKGWMNHPALIAWAQTPGALIEYTIHNSLEMKKRGCKTDYVDAKLSQYKNFTTSLLYPVWLGDEEIHSSHRARLLQKGFEEKLKYGEKANTTIEWYKQWKWPEMNEPNFFEKEYSWPINITEASYDKEVRVSKDALKTKQRLIETYGENPWMQ